ncbi:hypothetical protein [Acanthopleuribacter pedis]|uniref:Diaminopimelate epimerase n=1 Tax=Acanthopleuribacter pedis TaxID=442870 RepID=A0A8J7QCA0_9BACT|nr:hypothetical protein [Acanthopleuribacter pedis]MBO1316895.1 hypothetical protein [Acanthopleuribacter pedis]
MHQTPLPFDKVEGCGNDFVLLYQEPSAALIPKLCDRHHGVGADGIMVWQGAHEDGFRLDHYDPDGGRTFCLNGIRAGLNLAIKRGDCPTEGVIYSEGSRLAYRFDQSVFLRLDPVPFQPCRWVEDTHCHEGFFVDVGNPQFVLLGDLDLRAFRKLAPRMRAPSALFPNGANVNLLLPAPPGDRQTWHIYTFERGVENFTRACGSGMYAAAMVVMDLYQTANVRFIPEGRGHVRVEQYKDGLWLTGDTQHVFQGTWLCG